VVLLLEILLGVFLQVVILLRVDMEDILLLEGILLLVHILRLVDILRLEGTLLQAPLADILLRVLCKRQNIPFSFHNSYF
jgi:hypothetical protein